MADLTLTLGLTVNKSGLKYQYAQEQITVSMSGTGKSGGVLSIPVAATGLGVTETFTPGWAMFVNLASGSTNYIDIGVTGAASLFIPFARVYPGEPTAIPLSTLDIWALSLSGAAPLDYTIFER